MRPAPSATGRGPAGGAEPDAGFATVWVAVVLAAVSGLVLVGIQLGEAVAARHRAEAAADLAALAAAAHAGDGDDPACAYAARVAGAMTVRLVSCRLAAQEAWVVVEARPRGFPGAAGSALGRARAGPEQG